MEIEREDMTQESWAEVMPMFQRHWDEFQGHKKLPLDPDIDGYSAIQDAGMLLYVTVRDHGALIGYWLGLLTKNLHSREQLVCMGDSMYLMPEYRNGTGGDLLSKVEQIARKAGANRLMQGTCVRFPLDHWLERQGYDVEDHVFIKELK